jgi:hypothetical protein
MQIPNSVSLPVALQAGLLHNVTQYAVLFQIDETLLSRGTERLLS